MGPAAACFELQPSPRVVRPPAGMVDEELRTPLARGPIQWGSRLPGSCRLLGCVSGVVAVPPTFLSVCACACVRVAVPPTFRVCV